MALASFVSIFASAQINESEAEGMTKVVYAKSGAVQQGTSGTIDIVLKSDETVGCIACWFTLPDGVTVDESGSTSQGGITYNFHNGLHKFTILNGSYWAASGSTPYVIASIKVNVPKGVELGEYPLYTQHWEVTTPGLLTIEGDEADNQNILANVTVQKTAVIEPQRGDYALEAVPTCVATGATSMSIPVNFANEGYVDNISFNIEYPTGMLTTKSGKNYNLTVNKDRFDTGSDATLTVKATSGTAVAFTNGDTDLVEPGNGNLLTIPVTLTDVADGVYTIKFTDIKVSVTNDEAVPISTETLPDYYVTVIVGQPAAQEVILYGNYNEASEISTALKNVAIADVTAATVADGVKFTDVLVNEKGGNSYYTRTSANYGTTVLPLDLTTGNVDKLYKVESMDTESIVLAEAFNVPANTPCIFKGTINVEGATPVLGVPSEEDLGQTRFKGTYEATEIAAGAGYYISSNGCFYNDGATVRPFRAYFQGAVSGSKLRILLQDETGVKDITNELSDEAIYTLQGVRVNNAQKGINIKGGKKIYVK